MKVTDKVVVITGAASGIGRAMAERFARERPRTMVLIDRNGDGLKPLVDSYGALACDCDMSVEQEVVGCIDDIVQRNGAIDLFCGNAGILRPGGVETELTEFRQVMDVNVMAHVSAARAALPAMIEQGSGYFLITASAAGLLTQLGSLSYSVSKHAAVAVAEWLAVSYGHLGVKASALCPQAVETGMTAGTDGSVASIDGMLSAEEVAECVIEGLEQERFLILPHPTVRKYFQNKANDYDRWIAGMQKLQQHFTDLMPGPLDS